MRLDRSQIIWISKNGTGQPHTFHVSPVFLRLLCIVLLISVSIVPVLEIKVHSLLKRTHALEQEKQRLGEEMMPLRYLEKELVRIEEQERALRNHFGLEKHQSLHQFMGGGGALNINLFPATPDRDRAISQMTFPSKLRTITTNYKIINQLAMKQMEAWEKTPSVIPLILEKPKISSGFGWRRNPITKRNEFHAGIDIIGPKGTRIVAPASGRVIRAGYDYRLGNYLVLQHTDEIKTIYGHLEKVMVDEKTLIKRGDLLGFVGNTGMSTSHHLHYAVVVNNRAVDPVQFILDKTSDG